MHMLVVFFPIPRNGKRALPFRAMVEKSTIPWNGATFFIFVPRFGSSVYYNEIRCRGDVIYEVNDLYYGSIIIGCDNNNIVWYLQVTVIVITEKKLVDFGRTTNEFSTNVN